jgi:hypothetical protein
MVLRNAVVERLNLSGLLSGYVPYTGATTGLNLGNNLFTATANSISGTRDLTKGVLLANNTAATLGVPVQRSASTRYRGSAWQSTSALSRTFDVVTDLLPVNGSTPAGNYVISASYNGGSFAELARFTYNSNSQIGAQMLGTLVASGATALNSTLQVQSTIVGLGSASISGQAAAGQLYSAGTTYSGGTITFETGADLKTSDLNFNYSGTTKALSVGRQDGSHYGVIEAKSQQGQTIASPSITVNPLVVQEPAYASAYGTQVYPQLGNPAYAYVNPNYYTGAPYTANGSTYDFRIWCYDGSSISSYPYPTLNFTDPNDASEFDFDFVIQEPTVTTFAPTHYIIGRSINSGTEEYVVIPVTPGGYTNYTDNTGSYPDELPASIYGDFIASGQYHQYTIYGLLYDLVGQPYFSDTSAPYNYSFTDDGSYTLYRIEHVVTGYPARILRESVPGSSGIDQYFDSSGSTVLEESTTGQAGTTVTPTKSGVGYIGSGGSGFYDCYNQESISGSNVYSIAGSGNVTLPNDGNYYYIEIAVSGATNPYKIARSGFSSGTKIFTSETLAYDAPYISYADDATVTPTEYYLPALRGESTGAIGTALNLQRASGQTARNATYVDSDGETILAGMGAAFEPILPVTAGSSAATGSLFFDTDNSNLLSVKDSYGTVRTITTS